MHNCQNLNTDQRHHILKLLRTKWPPTDDTWWHPLDACRAPDALHVETAWFETQVSLDVLRMRLADAGYAIIWQLFEGTPHWDDDPPPDVRDCSCAALDARLATGASEAIWMPSNLDWVIYTDHNQGTYFVGRWLLELIEELWPEWEAHQWSSPFYVRPNRV